MPFPVTMPKLDQDMTEGTISAWLKAEGDAVKKGDALFEIETDKAAVEVEAEADGTLHHLSFAGGGTAPVEQAVAWIYAKGEDVGAAPEQPQKTTVSSAGDNPPADGDSPPVATKHPEPAAQGNQKPPTGRIMATPAAVAAAAAAGIDLSRAPATGPGGRIQKSDVLALAQQGATPAPSAAPMMLSDQPGPLSILKSGKPGKLPVVMIHGLLADASGWEPIAKPLAKDRPVYRIELPCHGRSPQRQVRDFAQLAAELRQAFDAIGLEKCHLIGHSLGAALALAITDTRPRKVASLTMIAPAGLGPDFNGDAIFGLCRASRAESVGPWLKELTGSPDAIGWSYVAAVAAARAEPGLRQSQEAMADRLFPDGVQGFDLTAALDRLEAPARIIWGRRDKIIPWRHALKAPGKVSLNLFQNSGHLPQYEEPQQLLELLSGLE